MICCSGIQQRPMEGTSNTMRMHKIYQSLMVLDRNFKNISNPSIFVINACYILPWLEIYNWHIRQVHSNWLSHICDEGCCVIRHPWDSNLLVINWHKLMIMPCFNNSTSILELFLLNHPYCFDFVSRNKRKTLFPFRCSLQKLNKSAGVNIWFSFGH